MPRPALRLRLAPSCLLKLLLPPLRKIPRKIVNSACQPASNFSLEYELLARILYLYLVLFVYKHLAFTYRCYSIVKIAQTQIPNPNGRQMGPRAKTERREKCRSRKLYPVLTDTEYNTGCIPDRKPTRYRTVQYCTVT